MAYQIFTDSTANLDKETSEKMNIHTIPFTYSIGGQEYICEDLEKFDDRAYYLAIQNGETVTTSQINPASYEEAFSPYLSKGDDILFISLSSGVSGSFHSAQTAAVQLNERFPERRVMIIDSLGASLGEGLLAIRASKCRDNGMTLDETFLRIQTLLNRMYQVFIVDDLMHLKRTGRLSNVGAIVGSLLGIKPLLKGNKEGKIVVFSKVRGRKQAIRAMADKFFQLADKAKNQLIGISHANCPEDVEYLIKLLSKQLPANRILTVKHEPVTGSHIGPGALALYFEGDESVRLH
ncbi:MAG: DegV family protein [Clostridia bacterium]|nr:DegV family protein [Clostridia bacterium]